MNRYLHEHLQVPIDDYLSGRRTSKETEWFKVESCLRWAYSKADLRWELRQIMLPYYRLLLKADICFFRNKNTDTYPKQLIWSCLRKDTPDIGGLLNDIDLVECAENWGLRLSMDNHQPGIFMAIVWGLLGTDYHTNWDDVLRRLREKLLQSREYGDYKQGEIYCVLIAQLLIYQSELTLEQKENYYTKLYDHWKFFCYLYSVMTRFIIGIRASNFASLAYNITRRKSDYPYIHLFYRSFKENFETICPSSECDTQQANHVRRQAKEHLKKIESIIQSTPPSNELDSLCELLFPKKIQQVWGHVLPQTYDELRQENDRQRSVIADWQSRAALLETRVKELEPFVVLAEDMRQQLETSISLETICDTIVGFEYDVAKNVFQLLDYQLEEHKRWGKIRKELKQKIEAKRCEGAGVYHNCEIYAAGAVHNDNRRQLQVGVTETSEKQIATAAPKNMIKE